MTLDGLFNTCYNMTSSSVHVLSIRLHLDCNVDLVFAKEIILVKGYSGLLCFDFLSTSESVYIIENVQQQIGIAFLMFSIRICSGAMYCSA